VRALTVRATVTNRAAPNETTKLLGIALAMAILPAATNDLDHIGTTPYFLAFARIGHKDFGIRQITPKTESGLLVVRFLYIMRSL